MSETKVCFDCGGKCCRDIDTKYRVPHMGAEVYEHWCDECSDGTTPLATEYRRKLARAPSRHSMRMLSLFSGIGGLDLGLEWAGMECVAQVECEPFPLAVLEKHWPHVKRYTDVRTITGEQVTADVGPIDCIAGGFPCQDISAAGKQAGIEKGERSGLWREYSRLVRELLPRWVIIENVPNLRNLGADIVLGELEEAGYACWPLVVGVDNLGGAHRRKRVFIIARNMAYPHDSRLCGDQRRGEAGAQGLPNGHAAQRGVRGGRGHVADTRGEQSCQRHQPAVEWGRTDGPQQAGLGCGRTDVADADDSGSEQDRQRAQPRSGGPVEPPRYRRASTGGEGDQVEAWRCWPAPPGPEQYPWEEPRTVEPEVGGATYGFPKQFSRWRIASLKGLGNAVSPQVAAFIGSLVMRMEAEASAPDGARR